LEKTAGSLAGKRCVKETNHVFLRKKTQSFVRSSFLPSTGQMWQRSEQTILITALLKIFFLVGILSLTKKIATGT